MIVLEFSAWKRFHAYRDLNATLRFMQSVAAASERAFKQGMRSAGGGVHYSGMRRASSRPGGWPVDQTGELFGSISSRASFREAVIGSNAKHSRFLREGTRHMQRRKMSDDALKEGVATARHSMKPWVRWKYGRG